MIETARYHLVTRLSGLEFLAFHSHRDLSVLDGKTSLLDF